MQRYTLFLLFTLLIVGLVFSACKHNPLVDPSVIDPDDPPIIGPGGNTCSPDSVYFQTQVLPILISNCTQSGCHNAQDHEEGIILTSYQSLMNTVEKVNSNNWDENELMEVIRDTDPDKRMPRPPNAPLTQDQINLIGTWVNQGAKNNTCTEQTGNCDPTTGTYAAFVKPLIQAKCQGCHSGSAPQGNINLSTYANAKAVAVSGKLYTAVTRTSNWMPQGGAKLDTCALSKLKNWIDLGAPEN